MGNTGQYISNWLANFDELLHNVGLACQEYVRKRLELSRAALAQFAESDDGYLLNWGRAEGESLFRLNDPVAGIATYAQLIERFPSDAFAYVGWGDEYSPIFAANPAYVDLDKALHLYRMGLGHGTTEDDTIRERIALLEQDLPEAQDDLTRAISFQQQRVLHGSISKSGLTCFSLFRKAVV